MARNRAPAIEHGPGYVDVLPRVTRDPQFKLQDTVLLDAHLKSWILGREKPSRLFPPPPEMNSRTPEGEAIPSAVMSS